MSHKYHVIEDDNSAKMTVHKTEKSAIEKAKSYKGKGSVEVIHTHNNVHQGVIFTNIKKGE